MARAVTYDGTNADDVLALVGRCAVTCDADSRQVVVVLDDGSYVHLHTGDTIDSELVIGCPHP